MPTPINTLSTQDRHTTHPHASTHDRCLPAIRRIRKRFQVKDKLDQQIESSRAATAATEQEIARVVTEREVLRMLEALRGAEEETLEGGVKMRGMESELQGTRALLEGAVEWEMPSFLWLVVVVLVLLVGFFSGEWELGSEWYGRFG